MEQLLADRMSVNGHMAVEFRVAAMPLKIDQKTYQKLDEAVSSAMALLNATQNLLLDKSQETSAARSRLLDSIGTPYEEVVELAMRRISPIDMLRPDTIIDENGEIKLVELETIIGGPGYVQGIREITGDDNTLENISSGYTHMILRKYREYALYKNIVPSPKPLIAVVITPHKISIYKPEFDYLAQTLPGNIELIVVDPRELQSDSAHNLYAANRRIDILHRFFRYSEFDGTHPSIKTGDLSAEIIADLIRARKKLVNAVQHETVCEIQPWIEPLESKAIMALLHEPQLESFWVSQLSYDLYLLLKELIPHTTVVYPENPQINKTKMVSHQKHRRGWLKPTVGWGARGQYRQTDSNAQFEEGLTRALSNPYTYVWQDHVSQRKTQIHLADTSGKPKAEALNLRIMPFKFGQRPISEIGVTARKNQIVHGARDSVQTVAQILEPEYS